MPSHAIVTPVEYEGNGVDSIRFESIPAEGDNTDIRGTTVLEPAAKTATRVHFTQMIAPDTPVPRLVQGPIRSFVQREAASAVRGFLSNVRREMEAA